MQIYKKSSKFFRSPAHLVRIPSYLPQVAGLGRGPGALKALSAPGGGGWGQPVKENPQNLYRWSVFGLTCRGKPGKPLRVGVFLPYPSRKRRKTSTGHGVREPSGPGPKKATWCETQGFAPGRNSFNGPGIREPETGNREPVNFRRITTSESVRGPRSKELRPKQSSCRWCRPPGSTPCRRRG